jgi:hypothetical protein
VRASAYSSTPIPAAKAGTFWSRMEIPVPRLIRTPTDAEHAACEWMQYWGFTDAFVAGGGAPDGGVDVDSAGAVAQVKAEMRPVSRPVVQQTYGIATHEGKKAFVFGLSGFTEEAAGVTPRQPYSASARYRRFDPPVGVTDVGSCPRPTLAPPTLGESPC